MVACVITGIIMMIISVATAEYIKNEIIYFNEMLIIYGMFVMFTGPGLLQLVWLFIDVKFCSMLDVKIIRDVQTEEEQLAQLPNPLFHKRNESREQALAKKKNNFDEIMKYKDLFDQGAISQEEFAYFKQQILNMSVKKDTPATEKPAEEIKKNNAKK